MTTAVKGEYVFGGFNDFYFQFDVVIEMLSAFLCSLLNLLLFSIDNMNLFLLPSGKSRKTASKLRGTKTAAYERRREDQSETGGRIE